MSVRKPPVTASAGSLRATTSFVTIMAVVVVAAMAGSAYLLWPVAGAATPTPVLGALLMLFAVAFGATALRLLQVAADAQRQVALTEDRLRALTDHALDIVAIIGPDQRVIYANRAVEQVLGRQLSAYVGHDVIRWVHPDDRAPARAALRHASDDPSRPFAVEVRVAHADGSWRTMDLRARGHFATPDINGLIVNARDITHRRQTEQALHDRIRTVQLTRELARVLAAGGATGQALTECARVLNSHFDAALVAFWTWEPEHDALVLRASAGRDWLQRDLPERVRVDGGVIGRVARERRPVLHLGESRNAAGREVFAAEGDALPAAVTAALTFPLVSEDRLAGVLRLLSFEPVSVPTVEAISGATSWIAAAIDRVRAEAALRESEERFRQLASAIDEVFWILSVRDAALLYISPAFETIWGRPISYAMSGRDALFRTVHPEDVEPLRAALERWLSEDGSLEYRIVRPDGSIRWLLSTSYRVLDESGVPYRLAGVTQDITMKKHAEERLAIERAYFATLFNAAPIAIVVHDENARVHLVNAEFERLFGYTADEVVGRDLNDLIVPPEARRDGEGLTRLAQAGRVAEERRRIRKDGTPIDVALVGCPVEIAGSSTVIFAMYLDIGERRRAEEEHARLEQQLQQAQKMEAIGRLAGGIAHDFNNLLTIIVGHTQLLLEQTEPASPTWTELEEVRQATERASSLTRQLLAFSRRQILQPVALDLNGVVVEMEKMLRRLISAEIELSTHLGSGLWTVLADPSQMQQVLLNLVVNARDAMPEGGTLEIRTSNRHISAQHPTAVGHELRGGDYTVLSVRDTGVGMDAATVQQVFEPFYTTKEPGRGTGLGLATVYGIVRQSGGTITVESEPGAGTTFHVLLPRSNETPRPPEGEEVIAAAEARNGAVVLVAEDEAGVRRVISTVLRRHGFDVIEAADGAAALEAAQTHDVPVDLLVTDVVMPGISGRQLAEQLRKSWPSLPVLFVSGYTEDEVIRGGVRQTGTDFLDKPFRPAMLLQRVAKLLDGVPAGRID